MPEFEEAGDTAVRESNVSKARRCWYHTIILSVTMCHGLNYQKDDYIYNTVKKRINIFMITNTQLADRRMQIEAVAETHQVS